MTPIDPDTCALLLRSVTDQIAVSFKRLEPDETVVQIIQRIREINEWAYGQMRAALFAHYPDIGWSDAEEANADAQKRPASDAPFWVYDPIDAAYHAIQGLPLWSSSLALVSGGKTIFGAVYEPNLREIFVATKGKGTTVNGLLLRPAGKTHLRSAIVATFLPPYGFGGSKRRAETLGLMAAVSENVFVLRQMASASLHLAYVAAGRLDAHFEVGSTPHDWLAGALLVEEAGLQVTDLKGLPFDWDAEGIVAAPQSLNGPLLDVVKAHFEGRAA